METLGVLLGACAPDLSRVVYDPIRKVDTITNFTRRNFMDSDTGEAVATATGLYRGRSAGVEPLTVARMGRDSSLAKGGYTSPVFEFPIAEGGDG
jgi:hypothetical protein